MIGTTRNYNIGFIERKAPELPDDPYPITIINLNDTTYEYARRYTTLYDPLDVGSIACGRLAIVGIQTVSSFYKSIDIYTGIANTVTQHVSVHSEPYLFTGITTINNTRLTNAWHFRGDPFTGTQGIGSTWGIIREFGFSFSNPPLATNSYGFYYGTPGSPVTGGDWGVFIDDDVPNYFKDLVLIGDYVSIGSGTATQPEPILQVFDNNKQGTYVESIVGVGVRPDTRYQLRVEKSASALQAARFTGDVQVVGILSATSLSGSISGGNVSGNLNVGILTSTSISNGTNTLTFSVSGSNLTLTIAGVGSTTLKLV